MVKEDLWSSFKLYSIVRDVRILFVFIYWGWKPIARDLPIRLGLCNWRCLACQILAKLPTLVWAADLSHLTSNFELQLVLKAETNYYSADTVNAFFTNSIKYVCMAWKHDIIIKMIVTNVLLFSYAVLCFRNALTFHGTLCRSLLKLQSAPTASWLCRRWVACSSWPFNLGPIFRFPLVPSAWG